MLATPTPALLACRVRLHVEHGVGKSKIEAFDREDLKPGVCIKREGQELAIPDDIALTSANLERYYTARPIDNWSAICQKRDQEDGQVAISGRTQKFCIWNHAYRAKYPFDLRLETEEPAPAKLKDYISLVRVFENGRLAFTWNQGSEARSVSIPYEMLKDTGLPFDAALELRVMPAGVPIDDAVLREPAKEGADRTRQVLRIFGQAALNEIVLGDPRLKAAYECYRWQLREIAQKVQAITGGSKPAAGVPPPAAATCPAPTVDADVSVLEAYRKAKTEGRRAAEAATKKLLDEIEKVDESVAAAVEAAVQKLLSEQATWRTGQTAQKIAQADAQLQRMLALADEVRGLGRELKGSYRDLVARAKALRDDTAEQARVFGRVAEQLETAGSPFQQTRPNPDLAPGEKTFQMKYREHFQYYILAPWNAVPIKTTGHDQGFIFDASNVLPVVDVFGGRWQWNSSRFSELRLAVGWMYYSDKIETETMVGGQPQKDTKEIFNHGPQINLGVGTLRAGVVVGLKNDHDADRWRLLLGLDLVKLISGQNLELR